MMVDKIVTMIHFLNFWDVGRGDVETYFSWKDRLEAGHGFADLDFIEIPLQWRIHDGGLRSLEDIILGFQERRM